MALSGAQPYLDCALDWTTRTEHIMRSFFLANLLAVLFVLVALYAPLWFLATHVMPVGVL